MQVKEMLQKKEVKEIKETFSASILDKNRMVDILGTVEREPMRSGVSVHRA